jgi:nitric oxide reductase large subunit
MVTDVQQLLASIITPSAVIGLCTWIIKRWIDRKDKEREQRELKAQHRQEEIEQAQKKYRYYSLQAGRASLLLGIATAHAIKDGRTNGELTSALDYAEKADKEQRENLYEHGDFVCYHEV